MKKDKLKNEKAKITINFEGTAINDNALEKLINFAKENGFHIRDITIAGNKDSGLVQTGSGNIKFSDNEIESGDIITVSGTRGYDGIHKVTKDHK